MSSHELGVNVFWLHESVEVIAATRSSIWSRLYRTLAQAAAPKKETDTRAELVKQRRAAKEPLKRAVEDVFKRQGCAARKKHTVSIVADAEADCDFLVLVEVKCGFFEEAKAAVLADETVRHLMSQEDAKLMFEELVREGVSQQLKFRTLVTVVREA